MADQVNINGSASIAKVRHPVAVPVLILFTLGIYGIYWWYQVNREMRDLGRTRNAVGLGDNPTTSALALFPGILIIVPPFFSLYNGVGRAKRAQEVTLGNMSLNGWIVLGLIVGGFIVPFLGLVTYGYLQTELNKVWETMRSGTYGAPAGPPPAPAQPAPPPPPPPPEAKQPED
jgi:hypothetical protein